ncbi:uncharacterized protein METZ01_LOCUS10250 [marine metagenome]|uniref:Uncharacterized protein n=1 Tax=marine metagenome TaxID=408172 RepID=A0A381NS10_9ZZZZ
MAQRVAAPLIRIKDDDVWRSRHSRLSENSLPWAEIESGRSLKTIRPLSDKPSAFVVPKYLVQSSDVISVIPSRTISKRPIPLTCLFDLLDGVTSATSTQNDPRELADRHLT